jgi:transcription initiation factor TFIIH subunit 1
MFVDLVTTMEDHEGVCPLYHLFQSKNHVFQTGNEKDFTMQAGRQKAALPLIRKFNEHSERLLNSAL